MLAKSEMNSTMKFLIYILLFLIFTLFLLLVFIIPSIKEYKHKKAEYEMFRVQNENLILKEESIKVKLKESKEKNSEILSSFEDDFNSSDFVKFSSSYFKDIDIIAEDKDENKGSKNIRFKNYRFKALLKDNTPSNFYDFIDDLKSYKNIIKINFPIELVIKKSGMQIKFELSVYEPTRDK